LPFNADQHAARRSCEATDGFGARDVAGGLTSQCSESLALQHKSEPDRLPIVKPLLRPYMRQSSLAFAGEVPMAQPAPVPSFEQGLRPFVEDAPSNPAAFLDGGPANRAISELTLALGGGVAKDEKWTTAQSLRLILAICGTFWLIAAFIFYMLH
jgi:hypothetical protein